MDYISRQRQRILATYGITPIQKSEENSLEKGGKHGMIGEIRNGYKKIAEGKWQKVSSEGRTKSEHREFETNFKNESAKNIKEGKQQLADKYQDKSSYHGRIADELDDKEYDDTHVIGGSDKKESSSTKNIDSIKEKVFEWLGSGQGRNVPTGKVKELVKDLTTKELKEVGDSVQDQISNTEPDAWDYDTIEELGVIFKRQFNWEDPEA